MWIASSSCNDYDSDLDGYELIETTTKPPPVCSFIVKEIEEIPEVLNNLGDFLDTEKNYCEFVLDYIEEEYNHMKEYVSEESDCKLKQTDLISKKEALESEFGPKEVKDYGSEIEELTKEVEILKNINSNPNIKHIINSTQISDFKYHLQIYAKDPINNSCYLVNSINMKVNMLLNGKSVTTQ